MPTINAIDSNIPIEMSKGGTAVTTLTLHGILMGNAATNIQATAEPTDGQLLIGKTGNFPVLATLTAGTNISITNGSGTITIASSGNLVYSEITAATKTIVNGEAYGANRVGGVAFALPAAAAIGTEFEITGIAGLWSITQAAGQQIKVGSTATSAGAGGSLTATDAGDCIRCKCITANTTWRVTSGVTSGYTIV